MFNINIAVILAGGIGSRIKTNQLPKQFIMVQGKTILGHTIDIYDQSPSIDQIFLVANKLYYSMVFELSQQYTKVTRVITGGETRNLSVRNSIEALNQICFESDNIIITDAVRPFTLKSEIEDLLNTLGSCECATTATENHETILKLSDNSEISSVIQRNNLHRQTAPEGYKFGILKDLYIGIEESIINNYTNIGIDELVKAQRRVKIVNCSPINIKITKDADIKLFNVYYSFKKTLEE